MVSENVLISASPFSPLVSPGVIKLSSPKGSRAIALEVWGRGLSLPGRWHHAHPVAELDGVQFGLAGHRSAPAPCPKSLCHHIGEFEVDSWLLLLALSHQHGLPSFMWCWGWPLGTALVAPSPCTASTVVPGAESGAAGEREETCRFPPWGTSCWAAPSSPAGVRTKGYMLLGWEMMVWRPQERMN